VSTSDFLRALAARAPWAHRPWEHPSEREVLGANAAAAGLYLAGAALTATAALLPDVDAPAGVTAVGVVASLTAAALLMTARIGRGGLRLAWIADLWGVTLIAVLCASAGGGGSPFAVLYLFAIGHAAAFQPRRRLAVVCIASLACFLAPLIYESVTTRFGATICIGVVLAALTAGVVHIPINDIRAQRRLMKTTIAATATLTASLDPTQTLRAFARSLVPELADICIVDLLETNGSIVDTVAASANPRLAEMVERVARAAPLSLAGQNAVALTLRTGQSRVGTDLTDPDQLAGFARSNEHRAMMREIGYRTVAVFPLLARGRTHGAVSFVRIGEGDPFAPDTLALLSDLSDRAAMAFDNARLYAERSHIAHTLRRSLMPAVLPTIPGLELASFFRPLGAGSEVGGDFYDAFGDSGRWWMIVGDVCGKGAEAAAITGFLRHTTAALTREAIRPATVLARVNHLMLTQDFDGRFATAALVRVRKLDTRAEITLASAGHPPALIVRADGRVQELGDRGTLLGVFDDPVIEEASATLELGDALALYTDGLLEAHAPEHIVTSAEMIERLERAAPRNARETLDALLSTVDLGENVRDDIVVLVGQMTGGPAGASAPSVLTARRATPLRDT
jgi:hypothetical protein